MSNRSNTVRYDFYGPIHKGLRYGSMRMLTRIGSLDLSDPAAVSTLVEDFAEFLTLAQKHLEHEDREVNGLLRARGPELADQLDDEHVHHYVTFEALDALLVAFQAASEARRPAALRALYLGFSKHVAADLVHMAHEEEEAQPILHSLFTDEELLAVEQRIVASVAPDTMLAYLRLMLPAVTPQERLGFLKGVQASAPPEVFQAVLEGAARPSLDAAAWRAVEAEFKLAA